MLKDKIKEISKTSISMVARNRYDNSVQLTGFIVQKPKVIQGKINRSCSFIIHQISNDLQGTNDSSFSLITYVPEIIEKLINLDKVCLIHCLGVLAFNRVKKMQYVHVSMAEISYVLDMELEPPYGIQSE